MYRFGSTAGSRECRWLQPIATKMALVVQEGPIHTHYNCNWEQSWEAEAPTVTARDRMAAVAMVAATEVDAEPGRYPDQLL